MSTDIPHDTATDTPESEGPAALPAVFNFAQHLLSENAARPDKTAFIDDHGASAMASWMSACAVSPAVCAR